MSWTGVGLKSWVLRSGSNCRRMEGFAKWGAATTSERVKMISKVHRTDRVENTGENDRQTCLRHGTTKRKQTAGCLRPCGGFTLIEILVVVTLLAMLAMIAIPNYLEARKDSAKSTCINNIKEISYATEQWALEMRKSPNSTVTFDDIHTYLKGAIVCPAGGKAFNDSYTISIVANEPTCQRQPQDHVWMGSTTVADLQSNKTPAVTATATTASTTSTATTSSTVNGLFGDPSGSSDGEGKGNGKGGGQNGGKGKGKGK